MRRVGIFLIQIYQKFLSPLWGDRCVYRPSCSYYAMQALEKYGFFKGSFLALRRILRCNPYSKGGEDPLL